MRLPLGLTGPALWLLAGGLAGGLTACTAQMSAGAGQLIAPTAVSTLPLAATATSTAMVVARLPTHTLAPMPQLTETATVEPTPADEPLQLEPTAVLTPIPIAPPAPDGTVRAADVPILMYHYISAAPSSRDSIRYGLSVPPEMFDEQLKALRDNGFKTVTLRDLYEHLATGTQLPGRPIILTFDDGYVDNYNNAFPLLQKYGMIGTFFVLTGPADGGDPAYLSWDMIQEMSSAGMDMQLHAREHLDMRKRPYDWLVFQIIGGRQSIEGHTGKPVIFMAYPSGKYDANVQRFLGSTNFWAAVTTAPGSRHALKDALNWDRVRISGQLRLQGFAKLLGISVAGLRTTPRPTAMPTVPHYPSGPEDPVISTLVPTYIPASTATPAGTQTPASTPSAPPDVPTGTPISSPLQTPTVVQSPLATPIP